MRNACLLALIGLLFALSQSSVRAAGESESVEQAICRLIDGAATERGLPSEFLTRLIWRESSFRSHVVSPAGAQGIAQFMPGTARERGLLDPFDPEKAIPESARLLADLRADFGNLGLAAAAYNAGAARVRGWIAGERSLPFETQTYVRLVTGRPAEAWLDGKDAVPEKSGADCNTTVASLGKAPADMGDGGIFAVAANFGNKLVGDGGDERIFRTLGQRGDFLVGGRAGGTVIEFQADEAGFPGFEDFLQASGCLNAERAIERK